VNILISPFLSLSIYNVNFISKRNTMPVDALNIPSSFHVLLVHQDVDIVTEVSIGAAALAVGGFFSSAFALALYNGWTPVIIVVPNKVNAITAIAPAGRLAVCSTR
jgi:hypothetical protein